MSLFARRKENKYQRLQSVKTSLFKTGWILLVASLISIFLAVEMTHSHGTKLIDGGIAGNGSGGF